MEIILTIQLVISLLLLVAVALPIVKNSYWIFRIFEYPRFQLWLILSIICISWAFTFSEGGTFHKIIALLLVVSFIYLSYKIWPYTPMAKRQVKSVAPGNKENQVRIYTSNVYQDNREYSRMIGQIKKYDPDIVLLVETDEGWKKNMDVLLETHPHYLGYPLPNTYGILMYSRFAIAEGRIHFLVEPDIPGIEATLELPSGNRINVWAVHPKPPVPGESEDSKAKDSEIMKVAFRAEKSSLPVIVMGDFNDVAWSKVTELFQKTAKLLDPRRGRGFYSTFSAYSQFVRFPLDYIFCSNDFGLIKMKRMPKNGSDHFAIFTHLQYDERLTVKQEVEVPDSEEREEAKEKAMAEG